MLKRGARKEPQTKPTPNIQRRRAQIVRTGWEPSAKPVQTITKSSASQIVINPKRRPMTMKGSGSFRLCFRFVESEASGLLKRIAARAGESVRELIAEKTVLAAIVIANWR